MGFMVGWSTGDAWAPTRPGINRSLKSVVLPRASSAGLMGSMATYWFQAARSSNVGRLNSPWEWDGLPVAGPLAARWQWPGACGGPSSSRWLFAWPTNAAPHSRRKLAGAPPGCSDSPDAHRHASDPTNCWPFIFSPSTIGPRASTPIWWLGDLPCPTTHPAHPIGINGCAPPVVRLSRSVNIC